MKMSLKWKFIIAITTVPICSLGIFFALIYSNFKTDRLASIYETALTQSRLLSKLTSERLAPIQTFMEYWSEFYFRDPLYAETIVRTMRDGTTPLRALTSAAIVEYDPSLRKFSHSQVINWSKEALNLEGFKADIETYRLRLEKDSKPLIATTLHNSDWVMLQRFTKGPDREIYILCSFGKTWIQTRFAGQIVSNNFWVSDEGVVLAKNSNLSDEVIGSLLKTIATGKSTFGAFQTKFGGTEYIASYTIPRQAQILMISLIKAKTANEALRVLFDQSLLLLGIFICFSAIVGILLSKKLTSALDLLVRATRALGQGRFDLKLHINTGDEIEELGGSVLHLAKDIQKLMKETEDRGRMESELLLAKEVQSTLFPPGSFDSNEFSVRGFSRSASECGGDWWGYFESETHFMIIVGDATGHGVPAALLTSAVNSLTALLCQMNIDSPKDMLAYMNRALHHTSQSKKTMTLSLLKIEKATGLLSLANAGHEAPLLLRNVTPQTKLNELTSLDTEKSHPLGLNMDSVYTEYQFHLEPGDSILMYTDGATDARDLQDKPLGERRFAKAVIDATVKNFNFDKTLSDIELAFDQHTKNRPLIDDITVVLIKYHGAA